MLFLLSFIFGASVGSFVQVIASRLNVAPIIKGRSKCLSCGEALRVSDLIPLVSYIYLKGRCRYCKSKYGIEALIIEILFGLIFLAVYREILLGQESLVISTLWLIYYTLLFICLGVIALYDRVHSYLPINFLLGFVMLCAGMFGIRLYDGFSYLELASPVLVALPFFLIWVITKGKGLGFGDVILFFAVGLFFGNLAGYGVFIISIWLGSLVGIYIKYIQNNKTERLAIPFVPFIAVSFIFVLFTGIDVISIISFFS